MPDLTECKAMMSDFIARRPDVWWEDVGEEDAPSSSTTATASAPRPAAT